MALLDQLELLPARQRPDGWPPGPAGNGLDERSVAHQVPMKLDF